jgi:hypothetical protein
MKNNNINYPGWELKYFDKANNFRNYQFSLIKNNIKGNVAEVGPGNGINCESYSYLSNKIDLYEPTKSLYKKLKKKFFYDNVNIINTQFISKKKYQTIIYLDVLEHIEDWENELILAYKSLKKNGSLIINVPAWQYLYSDFDRDVGHYKRFCKKEFYCINKYLKNSILYMKYYDCIGFLLSLISRLFVSNYRHNFPSKIKMWNYLVKLSKILDFFLFHKIGKSLLVIINKK